MLSDNIEKKDIPIEDVRQKKGSHPQLSEISDKQLQDKVRSLFTKADGECSKAVLANLPSEKLNERINRMFESEAEKDNEGQSETTNAATTDRSSRIFTREEGAFLKTAAAKMVKRSLGLSKANIENLLKETEKGRAILSRFSFEQIQGRVKYEKYKVNNSKN